MMIASFIRNRAARGIQAAFAGVVLCCAALAGAQGASQAVIEIAGPADKKDPHPITYYWEGENKPIYGAPAKFYTYYYVGTVSPDATVPSGVSILRVAVPNDEWELNRRAVLTRLASFYEEAYNVAKPAGEPSVAFDENFNYVETKPNENPGSLDPRAAAEWTFYYDQFVLWQFYCKRVLLNDRDAEKASSDAKELEQAAVRKSLEQREDLDAPVEEVMKAMEELESEGEDEKAAAPKVEGAAEVATEFDPDAEYADPKHNLIFRDEFIKLAEEREKQATKTFTDMLGRIDTRADEMQRFQDWLKEKKVKLHEFASAWSKVRDGDTFYIDDIFYMVTKEPLQEIPPDSLNVVVRDVVTPQDLIAKDGTIKRPIEE